MNKTSNKIKFTKKVVSLFLLIDGAMRIGYARVSTQEQNLDRQIDELTEAGCEKVLTEKISGAVYDRPVLQTMMEIIGEGDVVVVSDLTRLSRSTKDLFDLVDRIGKSGASIISLKESWLDTTTPAGQLMFTLIAGVAQFERDIIRLRTMEGLKSARARGRKGGRPKLDGEKIKEAVVLYQSKKYSLAEIKEKTGVSHTTIYRYLKNQTAE